MGVLGETYWDGQILESPKDEDRLPYEISMLDSPVPKACSHITGPRHNNVAELGCGGGTYSEQLSASIACDLYHGFDIRKNSLAIFRKRMAGRATIIKTSYVNLLRDTPSEECSKGFDLVVSSGLVEHFYGSDLDRCLNWHDALCADGGYICIDVPNFGGFKYLWYYLFDRPALDIHNLMTMGGSVFRDYYEARGYQVVFSGYCGLPRVWGCSSASYLSKGIDRNAILYAIGFLAQIVNRLLLSLCNGNHDTCMTRDLATFYLFVAKKNQPPESIVI
jgi:SAM-dependent methyltransferase